MARYACAEWEPIGWMNALRQYDKTQLSFHITAGTGDPRTIASWRDGRAGSNFVIFRDGRTVQLSDSTCKSAADYGAVHIISVEIVGAWGPPTEAQIRAMVALAREAHRRDGVPLRAARFSGDAGIGYHRLGVDGNFPRHERYGGRLQRTPVSVKTSGSFGKACPTDPTIDVVFDRVLPAVAGPEWTGALGWPVLREGDGATDVEALQRILVDLGYDLGDAGVDGDFGPATRLAVELFQAAVGLTPDGVVGEKTQAALRTAHTLNQEDDMLIIRRASDGASFIVLGGRGAKVVNTADLSAFRAAGAQTANLSDAGYSEAFARYYTVDTPEG
ncbi:N-acetylmuramoyl-L-alanine amidase [Antribacter gilvus]|uniref:peptidoglycan recognition protein family protein n=1 Tax=Antribacter gilvus TaxID=2304675 RepID=UPI000F7A30B4|nr:peptidoglycan-binding domain-containing protein [Antribacter gilvus]